MQVKTFSLFFLILVVEGQDDICPPGEEFWPHQDCTLYYICNFGNPILQNCPAGTHWSQSLKVCDFPENVPECEGGTRPPSTTSTVVTTSAPISTTNIPPSDTTPPQTTTPAPVTETVPPQTTTPAPPTSTGGPLPECPETGLHQLPYPGDCTLYIMCVEGIPIIFRCPDQQLFDTADRICKPESIAVCTVKKFISLY